MYMYKYTCIHTYIYINTGRASWQAATMTSKADADYHRVVTDAVHEHGGAICMQILHTGRYA